MKKSRPGFITNQTFLGEMPRTVVLINTKTARIYTRSYFAFESFGCSYTVVQFPPAFLVSMIISSAKGIEIKHTHDHSLPCSLSIQGKMVV